MKAIYISLSIVLLIHIAFSFCISYAATKASVQFILKPTIKHLVEWKIHAMSDSIHLLFVPISCLASSILNFDNIPVSYYAWGSLEKYIREKDLKFGCMHEFNRLSPF